MLSKEFLDRLFPKETVFFRSLKLYLISSTYWITMILNIGFYQNLIKINPVMNLKSKYNTERRKI